MGRDRSLEMGSRTGVAGLWDRLRFKEIYRQTIGLLLIAVCAYWAEPGHDRVIWGLAIAGVGQLWRVFAAGTIFKNKKLASTGAYALVRHPLYLGNLLILGGFVLACADLRVLAVVAVFFLVWYPAAVAYEDRKLENIFGEEWRAWSHGTWAVVPTRFSWARLTDTQWSAHQSLIRNGELYITIYLVSCAAWLWMRAQS